MILNDNATHRNWIEAEIYPGEQVLWVGNPAPRHLLRVNGTLGVTAALLVAAVLLGTIPPPFWLDSLFPTRSGVHVSLWHVASLVIAIGATAHLCYRHWLTKQVVYAITGRRALIIERNVFGDKDVRAYSIFRYIKRKDIGSDKGDLIFATDSRKEKSRNGTRVVIYDIGFFGIDQVAEVDDLLRETFIGAQLDKSL